MSGTKSFPGKIFHFRFWKIVLIGALGIPSAANATDLRCGASGIYFSAWPSEEPDYTLISRSKTGRYSATTVVTKTGPCRPCHYETNDMHGPIPLPVGQYTEFNNNLMFWDGRRWIAVGYYTYPDLMGSPQVRAYENVLRIQSRPAGDGKGQCLSTQISGDA